MRHILIAFAIYLLTISANAGTYIDDFDDGNLNDWEIMDIKGKGVQWNVENGVLVCSRPSPWNSFLRFGEDEWRNYSIECDAKMVKTLSGMQSVGLDLRVPKALEEGISPFVDASIWDSKTAHLSLWLNDAQLKEAAKDFKAQINQWYRLKAVANEDDFEFYIDEELLVSLSDPRASTGGVALNAAGCVAHFDNVVITGDDVPDNVLENAVVSSAGKLAAAWGGIKSQ